MTPGQLVDIEARFGGLQSGVPRRKVSPHDPRTPAQLKKGAMQGGDRMAKHGYSPIYAEHFRPFYDKGRITIVELGILRGSGLALLCEVFPDARVIGLEVDLSHWQEHEPVLRSRGAFTRNEPEVYEFDEFDPEAAELLDDLLAEGEAVSIFIDDALHTDDAILQTATWAQRYMCEDFRYFVEDNSTVAAKIQDVFWSANSVESHGRLTVVL